MKIHTVSHMIKTAQGLMKLELESFYKKQDALEFYTLKKEELENNTFQIIRRFFVLTDEYLTFEEMYSERYIYYDEKIDICSLVVTCRGETHYLNMVSHELIKFN